jgi:hypothetical protein
MVFAFHQMLDSDGDGSVDSLGMNLDVLASHPPVFLLGWRSPELGQRLSNTGAEVIDAGLPLAATDGSGRTVERPWDRLEGLAGRQDASLGSIAAFGVVEQLSYVELQDFLRLARCKLQPGGILLVDVMNPHPLSSLKRVWVDPANQRLMFPEVLVALCRLQGFASALVDFPGGIGDVNIDRRMRPRYTVLVTNPGLSGHSAGATEASASDAKIVQP